MGRRLAAAGIDRRRCDCRGADFDGGATGRGARGRCGTLRSTSFDALLATFTAGPDEIRAFVGPGPLLTDDRPLAEYFLSLPKGRPLELASLTGDVARFVVNED